MICLDPAGLTELRAYVESFWENVLGAYQEASDKSANEKSARDKPVKEETSHE